MKLKNFNDYLAKRLCPETISKIEKQATFEYESLVSMQKNIATAVENYMKKEKIGFNELVRRLGYSPSQVLKIQRGEANLTLASLAHISALLNKKPALFSERKSKAA